MKSVETQPARGPGREEHERIIPAYTEEVAGSTPASPTKEIMAF